MKKKIGVFVLCLILALSTTIPAFAANDPDDFFLLDEQFGSATEEQPEFEIVQSAEDEDAQVQVMLEEPETIEAAKASVKKNKIYIDVVMLSGAAQIVELNKTGTTLYLKQSISLQLIGTSATVTWSSSDKTVAKVTSKGKVTALKKGTATITAKAGGKKYTYKVTVKNPTISASKATLNVGGKKTLTVKNAVGAVTWSSSNSNVASVSDKGVVIGEKNGTATITAKASGIKLTCKITVRKPTVTPAKVTLKIGKKQTLTVSNITGTVSWSSNDKTVATVSKTGVVTAKAPGEATITAKIRKAKVTCAVTVEPKSVYTIRVANSEAADSLCEKYLEALCSQMAEESGGRLKFEFYPGGTLLGATEIVDGVKNGQADMGWSATSFYSRRFPVAEFVNLVGNGINSGRFGTDVLQQMYEEIPKLQNEFKDWKVIALHSSDYAPICTAGREVSKKDDFAKLILRTSGFYLTQYIEAFGSNPVSMPNGDVHEALEKNVIDGMTNSYYTIDCYKLYEPIDYCLDFPVNVTASFVLMNKDLYNSMDTEIQAIIDKYANGYAGDMAGYWWDSCRYSVQNKMKDNGVTIIEPSDEFTAWATSDEILDPIHNEYIKSLNEAGLDGQAIYDKCMDIIAQNAPAHSNDWSTSFNYTDWNKTADDYQ